MLIFLRNLSFAVTRRLVLSLIISCLTLLSACNGQEISGASTLGNNNAAQTNPDKIKRNSMDDQTQSNNHLDSNVLIESTDAVDP
ncbi:hypothetical protein KPY62_06655 [Psychrobacter sp. TAE2020]|uniref:hypothetical protein n=1 Tax=Psychrobacter sp. TAE2020 TaxID=2846762 RepID=UPI001C1003E5|nr:hypothetical protein [Psychrobacter sp. TAE2020]MBU5616777.1 hypothetical protein [Psychrobacter sp. TAE2020]